MASRYAEVELTRQARSIADEILLDVEPPLDAALIIRERVQSSKRGPNWTATIGKMDAMRTARFMSAVSVLQRLHPQIDWSDVQTTYGGVRRIARYLREATSELR